MIDLNGSITPIDTASNTAGPAVPLLGNATVAAISADGGTAYVARSSDLVPVRLADGDVGAPLSTLADTAWASGSHPPMPRPPRSPSCPARRGR